MLVISQELIMEAVIVFMVFTLIEQVKITKDCLDEPMERQYQIWVYMK